MIDWGRVDELRHEVGADEFDEVVELFLTEVEGRLSHVSSDSPVTEIEEDMHFLKGCALNLGFTNFATLCQELETQAARKSHPPDVSQTQLVFNASKDEFLAGLEGKLKE